LHYKNITTAEHIKTSLKEFHPISQRINLFHPNLQSHSSRVFKIKDKEGNKYKVYDFTQRIVLETKASISLCFSVNLPDNVCLANKPLESIKEYKVFTDHSQDIAVLSCLDFISNIIRSMNLKSNEGFFVYRNGIQLVIDTSRPVVREVQNMQLIKDILQSNFPDIPEKIDVSKIPSDLQDLIPLLAEWAISDDVEREGKINGLSKTKLKKMIEMVKPKMDLINSYLDSFKNEPLTYEAILIGNLAELVSELT